MGSYLRRFIKEYKGKKLGDGKGISGEGMLTNARIDARYKIFVDMPFMTIKEMY